MYQYFFCNSHQGYRKDTVEQTIEGADIKILSTGFIDKLKLQENIRSRLYKVGLLDAKVNIIEVPKITYLYSGKLNRFIPLPSN